MIYVVDIEATGAQRNKGHPFDPRNRIVLIGLLDEKGNYHIFRLEEDKPVGGVMKEIKTLLKSATMIVGQNVKYDMNWLRRYGILLAAPVFDIGVAHFLLTSQRDVYPSLDEIAARYELPRKPERIKEYWKEGKDTDEIPEDELEEYLRHDLRTTFQCMIRQCEELENENKVALFHLCMDDLEVLQEMEYNGSRYDIEGSLELARKGEAEIREIEDTLIALVGLEPGVPVNWGSPEQLSAILYGGIIKFTTKVQNGVFKTGARAGQPKFRNQENRVQIKGYFKPPKGGKKLVKEGVYPTDEDTLLKIKAKGTAKKIVDLVLKRKKLEKLCGTYYRGIPAKFEVFQWEESLIHPQLNQVVAVTGRLSCTNPNLQNPAADVKQCFVSRYSYDN